jgi:hypothetical protein
MLIKNQVSRLIDRAWRFRKNSKAFSQIFEIHIFEIHQKKNRGMPTRKTLKQGMGTMQRVKKASADLALSPGRKGGTHG